MEQILHANCMQMESFWHNPARPSRKESIVWRVATPHYREREIYSKLVLTPTEQTGCRMLTRCFSVTPLTEMITLRGAGRLPYALLQRCYGDITTRPRSVALTHSVTRAVSTSQRRCGGRWLLMVAMSGAS